MNRIKHIAIRTHDIKKTAAFYQESFGLKQVGLGGRAVYLSDGHINLAILPPLEGHRVGIDHLGFQVDNVEDSLAQLQKQGGRRLPDQDIPISTESSPGRVYFEIKCAGPDDQVIDISGDPWIGTD